jgi:hypothetical protein
MPHWSRPTVELSLVVAFWTLAALPATWVAWRRLGGCSVLERLSIGAALGTAVNLAGAYWLGIVSLGLWPVWWGLQGLVALTAGWRVRELGAATAARARQPAAGTVRAVVFVLSLAGLHLYALHFSVLPRGVDASFHCTVAQHLLERDRVTSDLWPLEPIGLNYSLGSHVWVAVCARWTGLDVHTVFRHCFFATVLGGSAVVGAWSGLLFGPRAASWGAFAFAFASFEASWRPYLWGGLPSAMAMWLALAALGAIVWLSPRVGLWAGGVLLGAMTLAHHHTWVACYGALTMLVLAQWVRRLAGPVPARSLVQAMALGLLVAAVYVGPLAGRAASIGETSVGRYLESFEWPWMHVLHWGPAIVWAAVAGAVRPVVEAARPARRLLVWLACIWLGAFLVLNYLVRMLAQRYLGAEYTPFTPSRFLFDTQFVLAVFAGGGLDGAADWLGRFGKVPRWLLVAAVAVALLAQMVPLWADCAWTELGSSARRTLLGESSPPRPPVVPMDEYLGSGRWARDHLPANALVVGAPGQYWLTYLCRRESTSMFLPISEPTTAERRRKQPLSLVTWSMDWNAWSRHLSGRPLYAIVPARFKVAPFRALYSDGVTTVYRLDD